MTLPQNLPVQLNGNETLCIVYQVDMPHTLCEIDDELKAIYHSKDGVCIWVFGSREDRNNFVDETAGMLKAERESHYEKHYHLKIT